MPSFPFRLVVGIVTVAALCGCGAATVTTWYTDPSKSDYPIRLTNWPAIALTVADQRVVPEKLFVRWIDSDVTWEKHSAAAVGEIQRVILEAMGGRISGDNPTELRITIRDFRASWDSPNWLGFAALEASVWKSGAMPPSLSWKSSAQTKQWNWFGVDTARAAARDAFKIAVADLLRQLYSDAGRLRSRK